MNDSSRRLRGLVASTIAAAALAACTPASTPPAGDGTGASAGTGTGGAADPAAMPGASQYQTYCASCHTIGGGPMTGPDLHGVTERRERDFLVRWIDDPTATAVNDPVGREVAALTPAVMPPMPVDAEQSAQIVDYIAAMSAVTPAPAPVAQAEVTMTDEEMGRASRIYFDRCAGCHGTMRNGATGPRIQPDNRTRELGTTAIENILTNGTPGGMPAWGRLGMLTPEEINLMARFIQLPPPPAPPRPIEEIRASWDLRIPVEQRPTEPQTTRDWQNFFGVILRDAGQVAIMDGDTHELVRVLDTGFAVHILRSSSSGRYFYAVGRDGRVTMIDLWTPEPTITAQIQGCTDARSVDASKFEGFEDRYVIEGCYWPPQYVVMDGNTLEPLQVVDVLGPAVGETEPLTEVRVASIVASHSAPVWVVCLKESGYVAIVDYSQPGFPITNRIGARRFLHDGGWDHSGRYFMVAANMENTMAIIDVQEQTLAATIETGIKPHPGRGANWEDPEFGWVNATTHIGEGRLVVYGADPVAHPENAWRIVRNIPLEGVGGLFVKTHPNSDHVWFDSPLSNVDDQTRQVCVYNQNTGAVDRCWVPFENGRAVHFEYNRQGSEVWVSGWNREGQIVVYNDQTLEEVARVTGDWLVTPTGKFNVYNTAHDVY